MYVCVSARVCVCDTRVTSRLVPLCTSLAPADHAHQLPQRVHIARQRATTVSLHTHTHTHTDTHTHTHTHTQTHTHTHTHPQGWRDYLPLFHQPKADNLSIRTI